MKIKGQFYGCISFQKKRPLKDLKKEEIAFAVISVVNSLVEIVLAIQRLATTSKGDPAFTFALIIIINACKSETRLKKTRHCAAKALFDVLFQY